MASSADTPKHDLGSLRIHEGQRKGGKAGKVFGYLRRADRRCGNRYRRSICLSWPEAGC